MSEPYILNLTEFQVTKFLICASTVANNSSNNLSLLDVSALWGICPNQNAKLKSGESEGQILSDFKKETSARNIV